MAKLATDQRAFERYKILRSTRINHQCYLADEKFVKTPAMDRAYSRGGADRYYRRKFEPSVLISHLGRVRPAYTPSEIAAYSEGWDNETERKEW